MFPQTTVTSKLTKGKRHKSSHRRTPSKEDEKDLSPAATGDVGKGMEDIQLVSMQVLVV